MSRRTRTLLPTAASLLRPEIIPDSTMQLRVEKAEGQALPWPWCKTLAWTRDWTRSPNRTLAEESNVEASYSRRETLRQVKSGHQTLRRNRQFLRYAAEPTTQDKQRNKDGATLPGTNHKDVPTTPTWPATPFSPMSVSSAPASPAEHLSSTSSALPVSQKTRTRSTCLPSRFKDWYETSAKALSSVSS